MSGSIGNRADPDSDPYCNDFLGSRLFKKNLTI